MSRSKSSITPFDTAEKKRLCNRRLNALHLVTKESNFAQIRTNGSGMYFHDHGTTWFLAQFKPNSHRIAERNLVQQGFRTFLPLHEESTRVRGKFTVQRRPLFPGYIFVALDLLQGRWRAVNSTHGITRIVSLGKEPTPVPLDLVSQLMLRCDQEGMLLPPKFLKPGDQVTIKKGPFAEVVASIESVEPDRRVWVLMDIMGGKTRVAVKANQLRTA